ncbi:N-acetylmuramoyl-L-alanine amidase family protein [Acetohalobium arabaticum]|uniref:Cell wall hydrolase/autolysin n=1 Tax=Acetohalobium arabaticum (strain ATCC 49924 / DSM 5501 / Z-7288) TaxID=574087 RepID=D9QQ51_ACEAZ|nr:N-acetylmuramoyl-L-alanine amidase [Acetohalobium arabaticum]ADL12642.1 cell wall hydrolase/autolysin [Acetohalobium arabaticum DSM 5501]
MWIVINRKLLLYIVIILLILTFQLKDRYLSSSVAVNLDFPLNKKVIMIDPGHGGIDGGTNKQKVLEKNINLAIALKLKKVLDHRNVTVKLTRKEDQALDHLNNHSSSRHLRDLWARVEMINQEKIDLFISLHVNAGVSYLRGPKIFYKADNKRLAYLLQNKLNNLEYKDIKHPTNTPLAADYFVLNHAKPPGVIVEVGYITNPVDYRLLQQDDYQWVMARTLAAGIEEYFSSFSFYLEKIRD